MNLLQCCNFSCGAMRITSFSKILQKYKMLESSSSSSNFTSQLRTISLSNLRLREPSFEQSPEGLFVQTLPVVIHPWKDKLSQQSRIPPSIKSEIERKILLCKWNSGDFKDRYTGLIRKLTEAQFQHIHHQRDNLQKESILRQIAFDLLPSSLQPLVKELDLVGILRFEDPPVCNEYVYIANLVLPPGDPTTTTAGINDGGSDKSAIDFQEIIRFDEHPCFWFHWEEIPFPEMPADDELWYPKVLWEGKKVKGSFTFGGWSEKTIKSFELFTVDGF